MSKVPAFKPVPGLGSVITTAGQPLLIAAPGMLGGFIWNPLTVAGQGVAPEELFVDMVAPAGLAEGGTTVAIQPGQGFRVPPNLAKGVSVNAATVGHRFTSYFLKAWQPIPDSVPQNGNYPPLAVTGRLGTIPAYLYEEYTDDDDLQAFFTAYNQWQQDFVDTFNGLNLPIYTQGKIKDALLDWVGQGIYGYPRPTLSPYTKGRMTGPYNTFPFNTWPFNYARRDFLKAGTIGSDDIYKRCLTWHFLKGDGKYFNIRWLKRRIMRWLTGVDGTNPNIDQTYRISVTIGRNRTVQIRIIMGKRLITRGAIYNGMAFNSLNPLNSLQSTYVKYAPIPLAEDFATAVNCGVLELPFQFKFNVVIS